MIAHKDISSFYQYTFAVSLLKKKNNLNNLKS